MITRKVGPDVSEDWFSMRFALWPETDEGRHRKKMAMTHWEGGTWKNRTNGRC